MDLQDRIRAARVALGLTQRELAVQVSKNITTVQGWEVGRSIPNGEALCRLVEMGVDGHWLLGGVGSPLKRDQQVPPTSQEEAPEAPQTHRRAPLPFEPHSSPATIDPVTAALLEELKTSRLGEILLLSRRGAQLGQWRILEALLNGPPSGMTLEEIYAAVKKDQHPEPLANVSADCELLLRADIITAQETSSERRYVPKEVATLRAGPQADRLQGILSAVKALTEEIAPEVWKADRRAQLYKIGVTTQDGRRLMETLKHRLITEIQQAETAEGEELSIVLGMVISIDDAPQV